MNVFIFDHMREFLLLVLGNYNFLYNKGIMIFFVILTSKDTSYNLYG